MSQSLADSGVLDGTRYEIRARAVAHMVKVVEATPADNEPFPHFIAHGILPDDIYHEMLALLPAESLYKPFSLRKHSLDHVSNRRRFKLTDAAIAQLTEPQQPLWLGVRDALGAPELKSAVYDKLRAGLALRFGVSQDEVRSLPGYPRPELYRETSGYSIKPHPDTTRKVVTMQLSLPADASQGNLGTEFYRISLNPLHLLREPRGFEVVKQAPFLPNSAYAFCVLNMLKLRSWHGRTNLPADAGVRNTILNIWYLSADDANPDIVEGY